MEIVTLQQEHKVRTIDATERNKFRFEWLNKTVTIKQPKNASEKDVDTTMKVSDTIKKIETSGKVLCQLCSDTIYYGKRGLQAITDHLKSKKHFSKVQTKNTNYSLPSSYFGIPKSSTQCQLLEMSANFASTSTPAQMSVNVPLSDRITNYQSLVLGVLAQHNLPFTMAPVLIELGKILANDKKALNHLNMTRTTASYKMRLGLAKTFTEETIGNLQSCKFSLNIDEAVSSNYKKVVSILVSYFSTIHNSVVVQHLISINVTRISSETLFNEIVKIFENFNIPWNNLMSILMDSCNVMRGSKSGLESRIREKANHLLDIDGDSCHHIHNSAKKFCKPFEGHVEKYFTDLYTDFKWSPDLKECLTEICMILGVKYTEIENMVSHRWLSCYDVTLGNIRLIEALSVFYFSFLSDNDKSLYRTILSSIYKEKSIGAQGRANIQKIHNYLKAKKLTPEGFSRKKRIIQKLFFERRKTKLILHFYAAALPLLKKYVCLFQTKEPLIHKLYDEQEQLFLNFLSCFLKQEVLKDKTVSQLITLDISSKGNMLKTSKMFLGSAESIIANDLENFTVVDFLNKANQAYVQCAQYLQKKLPLNNYLLKCISAIDPIARGHSVTLDRLKTLPKLVKNILTTDEQTQYSLDVHLYQVDKSLPPFCEENGQTLRVDAWWATIFNSHKYSALSKMVKAILSCFHGPQVESSFSMMGDVLDAKSSSMNIETFSAIQTVKYKLLSQNKTAIEFFKKKDFLHDPVGTKLCYNMKTANQEFKKELLIQNEERQSKRKLVNATKNSCSKISEIDLIKKKENNLRLIHKRRLEKLAKEKQSKRRKLVSS